MLNHKLMEDMKKALKGGDKIRLSVIRMLRSEIKNAEIAAGRGLEPRELEMVLKAYARKRKEAIEKYKEAGREDLVAREKIEYEITLSYLPPRMEADELAALVDKHITRCGAGGKKDFGRVMKSVMAEAGSRVEGEEVSRMVRELLEKKEADSG